MHALLRASTGALPPATTTTTTTCTHTCPPPPTTTGAPDAAGAAAALADCLYSCVGGESREELLHALLGGKHAFCRAALARGVAAELAL